MFINVVKIIFLIFLKKMFFLNNFFYILNLIRYIKNNFLKIKKYYFNIFFLKNTLKPNQYRIIKYTLYLRKILIFFILNFIVLIG